MSDSREEVGMLSGGSKGYAWRSLMEIQGGLSPTMTRAIRKASSDWCVNYIVTWV